MSFSPWRYEAYEDIKTALMETVLAEVGNRVSEADEKGSSILTGLRRKLARMVVASAATGKAIAPSLGSAIAAHQGLPAELGSAAGTALAGVTAAAMKDKVVVRVAVCASTRTWSATKR